MAYSIEARSQKVPLLPGMLRAVAGISPPALWIVMLTSVTLKPSYAFTRIRSPGFPL
ncbi:MAG: hypothetical protein ABIJ04_08910 [Bacteroidota bacterium]